MNDTNVQGKMYPLPKDPRSDSVCFEHQNMKLCHGIFFCCIIPIFRKAEKMNICVCQNIS